HARYDLDRKPERLTRKLEKGLLAPRDAQRVGTDDAHAACMHHTQPLTEALQTGERARRDFLVEAAVLTNAGGESDHLAQSIDDHELAVRVTRDHHVEAVGAEIDRRDD